MANPRVSVVIPTFDRAEATARAVRSALDQKRQPDEVLVVDDASPVPVSVATLGIEDDRLRIIRLARNVGASGARQAGIEAATGEFVAFLDSDDRWLPNKLAAQLPLLEGRLDDLVAVACGWVEEGTRARRRMPVESDEPEDFASGCWFCPGSTVILPRAALAAVGPFDAQLRRLEDLDWFLRLALAGGCLRVAPVTGAVVSIGRRAKSKHIDYACERIERRFAGNARPLRRKLAAYLELEKAASARNERRWVAVASHLARSFRARPRGRVPLRNWWR